MSRLGTEIDREALGWLVRVNDRAFAAWDDWDRWVAADPAHAEAYWRLAEAEGDAVDALAGAWFGLDRDRTGRDADGDAG